MRHYYLVAYDISNPKRLSRVMKIVRDFGERVQLSVFICQLTEKDKIILRERLRDVINSNEDQVMFVKLGSVHHSEELEERMEGLGRPMTLRDLKIMIY